MICKWLQMKVWYHYCATHSWIEKNRRNYRTTSECIILGRKPHSQHNTDIDNVLYWVWRCGSHGNRDNTILFVLIRALPHNLSLAYYLLHTFCFGSWLFCLFCHCCVVAKFCVPLLWIPNPCFVLHLTSDRQLFRSSLIILYLICEQLSFTCHVWHIHLDFIFESLIFSNCFSVTVDLGAILGTEDARQGQNLDRTPLHCQTPCTLALPQFATLSWKKVLLCDTNQFSQLLCYLQKPRFLFFKIMFKVKP